MSELKTFKKKTISCNNCFAKLACKVSLSEVSDSNQFGIFAY